MSKSSGNLSRGQSGYLGHQTRTTTKAKLPGYAGARSINPDNAGTIANLSSQEKEKVSRLVQRLVTLGQEHEEALLALKEEKGAFADGTNRLQMIMEEQLTAITEKLRSKDREISELETKNSLSAGLLALYQAKLKNSTDMFRFYDLSANDSKIKIKQLESDVLSLQTLVVSQKEAIESFEASRASHSMSLHEARSQQEASAVRFKSDMRNITEKLAQRDEQILALQEQLELLQRASRQRASEDRARAVAELAEQAERHRSILTRAEGLRASAVRQEVEEEGVSDETGVVSAPHTLDTSHYAESAARDIIGSTDIDIYGPLYSSIETSAISFSSSHHSSGRKYTSGKENDISVLSDAAESTARSSRGEQFRVISERSTHEYSVEGGHPQARTALDPTPMKRKPKETAATSGGNSIGVHTGARLAATSRSLVTPGSESTEFAEQSDKHNPVVHLLKGSNSVGNGDIGRILPGKAASEVLSAVREKKKKKGESTAHPASNAKPSDRDPQSKTTIGTGKKKTSTAVLRRGPSAPKRSEAASPSAQRHHTFNASSLSALLASPRSTQSVLEQFSAAPSSAHESSASKNHTATGPSKKQQTSVSVGRKLGTQTITYDDSLFSMLNEMDNS